MESCYLWNEHTLKKIKENCLPYEGIHPGAGKRVLSLSSSKDDELTITPIFYYPVLLEGEEVELGNEGGLGGEVFLILILLQIILL